MSYTKIFNPPPVYRPKDAKYVSRIGDNREGLVYVFSDAVVLAINVAIATGRPLLVRGPSGSGKSSLARSAANVLGWRYQEQVITSRTQARELLYDLDLLGRLHDAQAAKAGQPLPQLDQYIRPKALWWALDPDSARKLAGDPSPERNHARTVVLLDEIDKADPDVPNNLLVPLGSLEFQVEETGQWVKGTEGNEPLVVVTSNDERELPRAFLRRCVPIDLPAADSEHLLRVGLAHYGDQDWVRAMHKELCKTAGASDPANLPSAAEFLDILRAADQLQMREPAQWKDLQYVVAPAGKAAK
jgi:MoxR-like ATPase